MWPTALHLFAVLSIWAGDRSQAFGGKSSSSETDGSLLRQIADTYRSLMIAGLISLPYLLRQRKSPGLLQKESQKRVYKWPYSEVGTHAMARANNRNQSHLGKRPVPDKI